MEGKGKKAGKGLREVGNPNSKTQTPDGPLDQLLMACWGMPTQMHGKERELKNLNLKIVRDIGSGPPPVQNTDEKEPC